MTAIKVIVRKTKGGPGSGNWGHSGRPGLQGGSAPGGGVGGSSGGISERQITGHTAVKAFLEKQLGDGKVRVEVDVPISQGRTRTTVSFSRSDGYRASISGYKNSSGTYSARLTGNPGKGEYSSLATWGKSSDKQTLEDALNAAFEDYKSWHS
jgi:hypothetical protein